MRSIFWVPKSTHFRPKVSGKVSGSKVSGYSFWSKNIIKPYVFYVFWVQKSENVSSQGEWVNFWVGRWVQIPEKNIIFSLTKNGSLKRH